MRRSKSAKQSYNPKITVRRSERLADKFKKLPDDLILKILSNIQDDPKTLILCSSVCKHWNSLVSKIDTLSLRFLCAREGDDGADDSLLCSHSHHHMKYAAFPALMKVFANLTSLEIKLCSFPSSPSLHVSRLNCMIDDVMILNANMQGSGSRGKVFIGEEELDKFLDLISTTMVYESWLNWLNNPRNVTYWIKNPGNDERSWLRENVWVVNGLEFPWMKDWVATDIVVMESVVKELLSAFDDNGNCNDDSVDLKQTISLRVPEDLEQIESVVSTGYFLRHGKKQLDQL
ncbi:unnamed protein product [Dovyalis caffra]|uniref:F-box domain-containing protein n=1 Tax=Dovyalis caffra TaxID=77055 RepID=A0AAV1RRP6_9ROSI|nr:unnamed protein product [Dovyalis caffra]